MAKAKAATAIGPKSASAAPQNIVQSSALVALGVAISLTVFLKFTPQGLDATGGGGPAAAADPAIVALEEWLLEQGAVLKGVTARAAVDSGGGRGLYTTTRALPGQLLLTIPKSAWLSSSTVAQRSGIARILASADPEIGEYCQPGSLWTVILALEHERHNTSSHWRPYIDSLPDPTSPVLWDNASLAGLESPALVAETHDLQRHIKEVWHALVLPLAQRYPDKFDGGVNTLESFTWSALTVWGRVFDLGRWNTTENGLMPLMDFANHRWGCMSRGYVHSCVCVLVVPGTSHAVHIPPPLLPCGTTQACDTATVNLT